MGEQKISIQVSIHKCDDCAMKNSEKYPFKNPFTMADKSAQIIVAMTAREVESALLARCVAVARGVDTPAQD